MNDHKNNNQPNDSGSPESAMTETVASESHDTIAAPVLPVLPIRNSVLFPQMMMPMAVGRSFSLAAAEAAMSS